MVRAALVIVALFTACSDDPTGPKEIDRSHRVIEIGSMTEGRLTRFDEVDTLMFVARKGQSVGIILESNEAAVVAELSDVDAGMNLVNIHAGFPDGVARRAYRLDPRADGEYRVMISLSNRNAPAPPPPVPSSGYHYRFELKTVGSVPEQINSAISPGVIVDGEHLETPVDVDDFIFTAEANTEVNVFLTSPTSATPVRLSLYAPASDSAFARLVSYGPRFEPEVRSGIIRLPASGQYRIRIATEDYYGSIADTEIPYELEIYPIQRAPEHTSPLVTREVSSEDRIERPGDIDEFRFSAEAGETFDLLFSASSPQGDNQVYAHVVNPSDSTIADTGSSFFDEPPSPNRSGFFQADATGEYIVRVFGNPDQQTDSIAYNFVLHAVNRSTEHVAPAIMFGTPMNGERIDDPTDIDEYTFELGDSAFVWVLMSAPTPIEGALKFQLHSLREPYMLNAWTPTVKQEYWLPAGRFTFKVFNDDLSSGRFTGAYTIRASKAMRVPESAPAVLRPGDVVVETVNLLGDIDDWRLELGPRAHVNVRVQGLGGVGGEQATFMVGPVNAPPMAYYGFETSGPSVSTGRLDMTTAGQYQVYVKAGRMAADWDTPGSYELSVTEVPTNTEQAPSQFDVGDSVAVEAIDAAGDVDRYTLNGTPGQSVIIGLSTANVHLSAQAFDLASGADRASITGYGATKVTSPLQLDSAGRLGLDVLEPRCGTQCTFSKTGAYKVAAWAFNPAPERAPATLVMSDTVAEAIDHPGDVDQYTFTGVMWQHVEIFVGFPAEAPTGSTLSIDLIAPDGTMLTQPNTGVGTQPGGPLARYGGYMLSDPGTYTVRVRWMPLPAYGATPYLLVVK